MKSRTRERALGMNAVCSDYGVWEFDGVLGLGVGNNQIDGIADLPVSVAPSGVLDLPAVGDAYT